MVIAIFASLEGESLEDVSIRLATRWRIGQKGLDNGVIVLVFVRERRVRFEVGYGLEPVVPDAAAAQIIREVIAPRFREGRYASGLEEAVGAVFARLDAGGAPARAARRQQPSSAVAFGAIAGFFAVVVLLMAVLFQEAFSARRFVRRNGYTAGRGGGWSTPIIVPPVGWGGGGSEGGGFSGGGGAFGGGGASGEW